MFGRPAATTCTGLNLRRSSKRAADCDFRLYKKVGGEKALEITRRIMRAAKARYGDAWDQLSAEAKKEAIRAQLQNGEGSPSGDTKPARSRRNGAISSKNHHAEVSVDASSAGGSASKRVKNVFERLSSPPRPRQERLESPRGYSARLKSPPRRLASPLASRRQQAGRQSVNGSSEEAATARAGRSAQNRGTYGSSSGSPDVFTRLSSPQRRTRPSDSSRRLRSPSRQLGSPSRNRAAERVSPRSQTNASARKGRALNQKMYGSNLTMPPREKVADVFERNDTHGNGFLSLEEIKRVRFSLCVGG
eukprot:SAG11_NODE_1528_length_4739_cov_2.858190_1_plen_305_part_00